MINKMWATALVLISLTGNALAQEKLTTATFNVGFLDTTVFFKRLYVPEYQTRLSVFKSEFNKAFSEDNQPDIIGVQELWNEDASEVVNQTFAEAGYTAAMDVFDISYEAPHYVYHGLNIYFKTDKFNLTNPEFKKISRHAGEATLRYIRGVLGISLTSKSSGRSIYFGTTHLTPTIGMTSTRRSQLEEISQHLNTKTEDLVIMSGDFNVSPNFEFSIDNRDQEGSAEEWSENGALYNTFLNSSLMTDSYTEINEDNGFTQDRVNNALTDFSDSTREEPEQRIDYILYRNSSDTVCSTEASKLIFTESVTDENNNLIYAEEEPSALVYLSDHFGILTNLICN